MNAIKKKFPSLASLGSDGNTAFLRAARAGHLDKVLEHLKSNIDINTSNTNGLNALHLASKDGHVDVVTELLNRGATVDAATKKGNTALHIASLAGQEDIVKLLVANNAAVNVQSQNGFTPLYMAAQENHDNVVKFLLANGANQSLATEDGFTPLAVAMQQGHDKVVAVLLENDTRGKVRLPALHIAAKKDDCKAAALLLQNDHNPDVTSKSGFTPLHIAAHYGNESIATLLLNKGADVNYSAKHNISPLHVAAKWGKTNMVSLLLEKGANIDSKTRDGLTPLHCAARSGHQQVVDMMLERGAPISSKTKNGLAPLHMAAQGDHVDAARILLYHRAPVDEVTVDYLTALHVAAHCGHVRVAKLLLDRNADPNARALNGFTPLHIACKKNRIKVVELLLKHEASIEATTESGLTPLHVASFMGCMNIVIFLLQNDASPDVPTVRGETPLHLAARANQTDIIRILLRNGAQVDARAREQQTPLHIASRLGNVDIVMLLLQHGAAIDSTTKDLYTALHIAAKEGQEEVASVLLEHQASLTATTKKGFTPLHLAAKYGNMKVAKLLLQRDAPVDAQGKNGVTPLHVASHYDHQNVALLLLDKGASPHATAKNGHTPLHIAARKNQMDIATTLLEYGAKANAESKAGFTPLHLSAQEGHTDMSNLLIEHQADINHKAKNGLTPMHLCAQEDRVNVASVLAKSGAEIDSTTKAGYTPLHVASHFGHLPMVKFLLQNGANVESTTTIGYTPLHQASQQGHTIIINSLLENGAPPNSLTNQGQSALSIAQKLGYISVVETLKKVTDAPISPPGSADEKYKVVAPESMQETFMSDSEDEGGEDTMLGDQPYRYLTVDEMKSLGDDSLPIDVTRDERMDSNREMTAPPTAVDDTISPQHIKDNYQQFAPNYTPDNVDIARHPIHIGKLHWKNFLVSFLVDARGGAMRGCRHSGVRVIVPPRKAAMPMRITCRYLKRDKLTHPPPLMEGEALASRILELGPVGAKFLGPVIIEVPHFGSLRGMEREIVILRSDNGETWREHTVEANDDTVQDVLNESFEGEELSSLEDPSSGRMTRILTSDFPQYFAIVSRIRQEVHAIGPEGGMVSSSVVPQVQAVFPQGALTKKIKVGLQAQPISAELAAKLLGNRVAVSPIVTVEPRRRKFHKPITLTIPVPQAANKGMINQYSGDAPTLRLLCSITGVFRKRSLKGGTSRAQWEDVTGSTPLTFVNDCVSFTTTVSARFWLMDCRNVADASKMATELYREAIHVPFMAKFVVFAKRVDVLEARLRVFCMTDDKEDKTLEQQEQFTEVAKSRDVEVLEGKLQYVEFAGNLVPVTKSGDQLQLGFRAFRENRLPFTVRVKDPHADTVGRALFMREPKVAKGEPPQQPICVLNIVLPESILPETLSDIEPDIQKKYAFLREGGLGPHLEIYQRTDLRLSDISNLLAEDWIALASELGLTTSDINSIKSQVASDSHAQQAMAMLKRWQLEAGNKANSNTLETALKNIGREDIVQRCIFREEQPIKVEKITESVEDRVHAEKKELQDDENRISSLETTKEFVDKQDIDEREETKYIGEEKVVEEERRTVAQLKEIFAADKRDRQYERQPSLIKETLTKTTTVIEKPTGQEQEEIITKITTTTKEDKTETIITTKEFKKKHPEEDEEKEKDEYKKPEDEDANKMPPPEVPREKLQPSGQELLTGVSEELGRRLSSHTIIHPQIDGILSPKVSKTPPPSPADFSREPSVTTAWQPGQELRPEVPATVQEWTEHSQTAMDVTSQESSSHLLTQAPQNQEMEADEKPRPTPTPRVIPPEEPQIEPPLQKPTTEVSVPLSETAQIDDVPSYSDKKKFWEQMTGGSKDDSLDKSKTPIPQPRSSVSSIVSEVDRDVLDDHEESDFISPITSYDISNNVTSTPKISQRSQSVKEYYSKEILTYEEEKEMGEFESSYSETSSDFVKTTPVAAARKSKRSASLPAEDLEGFDHKSSVKTKKLFFENQIKKELVVDQLMTQLEEETSPEHKTIEKPEEEENMELRVIHEKHSDIISEKEEENIQPIISEDKIIMPQEEVIKSVKDIAKEFGKCVEYRKSYSEESEFPKTKIELTSSQELKESEVQEDIKQSVKDIAKGFEKSIEKSDEKMYDDYSESSVIEEMSREVEKESLEEDITNLTDDLIMESKTKVHTISESEEHKKPIVTGSQEDISLDMAEVLHYKTESISKPSDSLEVHVDKSETEENEKEQDIDEDIKALEDTSILCKTHEEPIPSITFTLSGKQRTDSCSHGESEDTASESDVTPEEARIDTSQAVFQPQEQIHDTVWEVPVQEECRTDEIVQDIPLETDTYYEKQIISEEEARDLAEQVVESIEVEVTKRSDILTPFPTSSPPVPPPELAESQVTEYLQSLVSKENLESKEMSSIKSQILKESRKLIRTDTTTSSMEITDEDLRSSGVETDLSPLEAQARIQDQSVSEDLVDELFVHDDLLIHDDKPSIQYDKSEIGSEIDLDLNKIQDVETVEKTLAEVRQSLGAAQEELLEEHKKSDTSITKKESPSEFEFKVLTFEKKLEDKIEESYSEDYSISSDTVETGLHGKSEGHFQELDVKSEVNIKGDISESHSTEITISKDGIKEIKDKKESYLDKSEEAMSEAIIEDVIFKKEDEKISESKISAIISDEQKVTSQQLYDEVETRTEFLLESSKLSSDDQNKTHKTSEQLTIKQEIESDKEKLSKLEEIESKEQIFEKKTSQIEESKKYHIDEATGIKIYEETTTEKIFSSKILESTDIKKEEIKKQFIVENMSDIESEKSHTKDQLRSETLTQEKSKFEQKFETVNLIDVEGNLESFSPENILAKSFQESDTEAIIEKEQVKRTSSDESQRSLSLDDSVKSPEAISSSSSAGRKGDVDSDVRVLERPDGSETVVVLRRPVRTIDPESSSSSGNLKADRRSGADFEAWSSSGESHYHSFEQNSESGRTYSRPCSSDVEALVAGHGTAGSSEYESALTSQEMSGRSTTSHEYHTAVSSLSSRESMRSLDSESSGHLASIEVSSEASETLVPSAMELEKDMDLSVSMLTLDDESRKLDLVEPYDQDIPAHIIRGESPPRYVRTKSTVSDISGASEDNDGRMSPFEMVSESEGQEIKASDSLEDDRPHSMKRSHEMIFQPEPHPVISESPLSESPGEVLEKYGSSVEDGSILSVSLSSTSEASGLRTVIELSRAESDRLDVSSEQLSLTVSGGSEQLSLEDIDPNTITGPQVVESSTTTYPPTEELYLGSVTLTTSSIEEQGVMSVSTQVTSESHTPIPEEQIEKESFSQINGPTQVDYIPEFDESEVTKKRGHRRKESTSSFTPAMLADITKDLKPKDLKPLDEVTESDLQYSESKLTLKEVSSDEKKDIDEAEKIEESYQTEADQGFQRDLRETRMVSEETDDVDIEIPELDSRPQSQVSKSDSESHRPMSSGFSDDRPDSELAELIKQCSTDTGKEIEDPIERPLSPEPADECEIKDDTPEFSSEAQASITELEMEYSSAFSRTQEYASHVSPIREERSQIQFDEAIGGIDAASSWEISSSEYIGDITEVEAAFHTEAHDILPMSISYPVTTVEEEKHELETRELAINEKQKDLHKIRSASPVPDITVTEHMTPLKDKGFHYPDLELEKADSVLEEARSASQTPASISSRGSAETETDEGREYIIQEEGKELEEKPYSKPCPSTSFKDQEESFTESTTIESDIKKEIKHEAVILESPTSDSPGSDSFEMLEKPDLSDEYVIIEEVGKEAEEGDEEGKGVKIDKKTRIVKKHDPQADDLMISPPTATRMTDLKYYPDGTSDSETGPFEFEDSPPNALNAKKSSVRPRSDGEESGEEYEKDVEAGKKWIEMQFQGEHPGYGYDMEFERGPLEDIKEEEATDFDTSSKVGSIGSYNQSIGSFGSVKESLSSTPDYDVLAGRKYFTRSGEHDDVSMSSLQEFENLESQIAHRLAHGSHGSHGSQDSLNGSFKQRYHSRSGQSDDISVSSLKEFELTETACIEVIKIETKVKEEERMLTEIEEGQESQSESCDEKGIAIPIGAKGESVDSDYEKRMFEIDEIIRQAQSNVEKFTDTKEKVCLDNDKVESVGRGDSLEEVAKVPELDLDQPLYSLSSTANRVTPSWCEAGDDKMQTSTDSLDLKSKPKETIHPSVSTDSLDMKTVADTMSASADSIELQTQLKSGDIMTDSIEFAPDSGVMATSTDSLDLAAGPSGTALMTDSIEDAEPPETHILGEVTALSDQTSVSGREGDLSYSGKEEMSPGQRAEYMLGSTDSLEPSSSTATHATYQYETDSMMSSSFTSGGSNTMVSSTETIDPSIEPETIDLTLAARTAGIWFEEHQEGRPIISEKIESSKEKEFSHTIIRTVQLPAEVTKVTFKGPDADKQLREYVESFGPGEASVETEEVDPQGNVHVKRVTQRRTVFETTQIPDNLTPEQLDQYLKDLTERGQTSVAGTSAADAQPGVVTGESSIGTSSLASGSEPPETAKTRGEAVAIAPFRKQLLHDISVDDETEFDVREHDWRFQVRHSEEEDDDDDSQKGVTDRHQTTETRVVDGGTVTTTTTTTRTVTRRIEGDDQSEKQDIGKPEKDDH